MKILYIGTPHIHNLWQEGKNPFHWLYGACEMEQDKHQVIWAQERSKSMNDLQLLIQHRPDKIFIPNLNLKSHIVLLLLSAFGVVHTPVYAYIHHTPKGGHPLKKRFYRLLLKGIKHAFFLSELTMQETIHGKYVKRERCSVPGWGADLFFFSRITTNDQGYFISTGKEQRDFDILIDVFKRTGAPLKIFTCKSHAGNNFEDLPERCKNITNIEVIITENSSEVYPLMLKAMADSKALVCPLRKDKLNYCVGLSTLTDAEGLHKPLIITHNPYHSPQRIHPFHVVNTAEEWINAIHDIQKHKLIHKQIKTQYCMDKCYEKMKEKMFL